MLVHPSRPLPSLFRLTVTVIMSFALVGFAAPMGAQAAEPVIGAQFFGLHHAGLHVDGARGWPQTQVGSVRLWDNGVSWREIERSRGVFSWSRLDALVAKARSNGASVMLVLGQTPKFHSTRPSAPGAYGRGASAMPRKAAWMRYVKAVARRNAAVWGNSVRLQVWNEGNAPPYWSGTPRQMAVLTAWTRAALRSAGSSAQLIGPAMVTRLTSQQTYLRKFYDQRVNGKNVSRYVDALSFQLYPSATGAPESSMTLLRRVRLILARRSISKPIYNTEINYGLVGGPQAGAGAKKISTSRQIGNVIRTFVLNAQNRVRGVYWYSWDLQRMSNTPMVQGDGVTLTAAGHAFGLSRAWLVGSRPVGCSVARNGVYSCSFRTGSETRRIVWHPAKSVSVAAPAGSTSYTTGRGATSTTKGGTRVGVGPVPVLFRIPR